jgi:hypothetical protein
MSQVQAISNETAISQESNGTTRYEKASDDFNRLLEAEKKKVLLPYLNMNFQSVPLLASGSIHYSDNAINKIENKQDTTDNIKHNDNTTFSSSVKADQAHTGKETHDNSIRTSQAQTVNNINYTTNAINKVFTGEMKITPEFYNNLSLAKNSSISLRSVDLDSLVSLIQDKIKMMKDKGKIELSINLSQDELGSMLMNISSDKGIICISIYANSLAKQKLDENIKELEISLKNANLNIGSLQVFSDGKRRNNNGEFLAEILYNNSQES